MLADACCQAEHGVNSPAVLLTSCPEIAANIDAEVQRQLALLSTADAAGPAWRDYGEVILVDRCTHWHALTGTLTGMHSLAHSLACTHWHALTGMHS